MKKAQLILESDSEESLDESSFDDEVTVDTEDNILDTVNTEDKTVELDVTEISVPSLSKKDIEKKQKSKALSIPSLMKRLCERIFNKVTSQFITDNIDKFQEKVNSIKREVVENGLVTKNTVPNNFKSKIQKSLENAEILKEKKIFVKRKFCTVLYKILINIFKNEGLSFYETDPGEKVKREEINELKLYKTDKDSR